MRGWDSGALAASLMLARKDLRVAWSYKVSFVMARVSIALSLVISYFTSRVVGGGNAVVGTPEEYFRFLVVGLAVGWLIETATGAAIGAARRDQVEGTLEAVATLPVGSATLGLGWLIYPLADGLLSVLVLVLLALPLGLWGVDPSWPALLLVSALCLLLFSALGLLGASMIIAFQQGSGVLTWSLTGLAVISGTVFPTSVMPDWLELIAQASPLKHALDATRAAALDGAGIGSTGGSLGALTAMTVVIVPLSLLAMNAALRHARRTGGLGRY